MGWLIDFMDAGAYILYGVDTKKERAKKARRRGGGRVAKGIVTGAITVAGAVSNPGMASSALPGHEGNFQTLGQGWRRTSQNEQRDEQTRGHRRDTTIKGRRRSDSSQQA